MKERGTPRYLKIAQDICGKIQKGIYPEGTLLKGRSVLGSEYGVSPETIRKALNLLEDSKIVSAKKGVGVFVDSVLHAQQFSIENRSKTNVMVKYRNLNTLLEEKKMLDNKITLAIEDMRDSFVYQTTMEAVSFHETEIPQDSWIHGKTIGDVYFWNYTEATIVAVVSAVDQIIKTSPGPDYVLNRGDILLYVGKDEKTFDRVISFITYGIETEEGQQQ